jgi:hypothetical protein
MCCAMARLVVACVALVSLCTVAEAGPIVGVGLEPPPPTGPFVASGTESDPVMIGTLENPIPITVDESPNAPPWQKQIVLNRDGLGWASDGPLSMATIMESITILPSTSRPPTDWHEDIVADLGDGALFKWAGGSIEVGGAVFPGVTSPDGKSIWFYFPPMPVPGTFKITKQLMWLDGTITPGQEGTNNYTVVISERPSVPEPATLVLASTGLASLLAVAWRRRCKSVEHARWA